MLGDLKTVLEKIKPTDLVLDVGGGMQPLTRADWVIDLMPYEERGGAGGHIGDLPERFDKNTWVTMDFSSHQKFPFLDKHFDFVFCSHTLEDIADPFWLCAEINRVGKRGYIETPSRTAESAMGVAGKWKVHKKYFAGYYHHRWFLESKDGELFFTFKYPFIHFFKQYQVPKIYAEQQPYLAFWWEGGFKYKERQLLSVKAALGDLRDFRLQFEKDEETRTTMARALNNHIADIQRPAFFDRQRERFGTLCKRLLGH